jgi:hypothetical protein
VDVILLSQTAAALKSRSLQTAVTPKSSRRRHRRRTRLEALTRACSVWGFNYPADEGRQ